MADQPDNMEQFLGVPERVAELIARYYDADLSEHETVELRKAMQGSAAAREWFVRLGLQSQCLAEALAPQYSDADGSIPFAQLAEMEDRVEAELVDLDHVASQRAAASATLTQDKDKLTAGDLITAGSYLFRRTLISRFAVGSAVAAVLLLGVWLFGPWGAEQVDPPGQPVANQSDLAPQSPSAARVKVATLTAAHNANWSPNSVGGVSALPVPGTQLHPNDRLTLTQGFAEITTVEGAVVILEAPATVELLDKNAMRLHAGKLVGICETPSSKGFLVHTPHMDVTDLGTRFGVDVNQVISTEVHVFDGEVEVQRPAIGATPAQRKTLTQGQALCANADEADAELISVSASPARFAKNIDTTWLGGTGRGHATGDIDRDWRVIAVDGEPITEHGGMMVDPRMHDFDSDPATSQWLRINPALNPPGQKQVVFTCQSSFSIPDRIDTQAYELVLRCSADFSVKAVRINGHSLQVPKNRILVGDKWVAWTLNEHFTPGQNTIEIEVLELFKNNGRVNSSSLRVELQAHRR
ncbi:MAG: FecR domain-containing protein [Phycisphaeraceae bacterium]